MIISKATLKECPLTDVETKESGIFIPWNFLGHEEEWSVDSCI